MSSLEPFRYRQKLMDEHEVANKEAQEMLLDALANGHHLTYKACLYGPYMNYVSYWLSNGEKIDMVEPASLHWVPLDIISPY